MNAERDRDRLLEDALKHQLRPDNATGATAACLDAETVAAWTDGGLDPQAAAMAEAHASSCARCQALLATVVRTTPAAVAAEPGSARLWRWWFAPLAATAAAATVWMVVPQDRFTAPPAAPARESGLERLEKSETATPPAPPPAAGAAPTTTSRSNVGRDRTDAPKPRAEAREAKREAQAFEAREPSADTAKPADTAAGARIAEAAPSPAPPAPPAAPPAPAAAMAQLGKVLTDERVTARSAPSPAVIWLVGRAGLVQLATDGQTFVRVPFPEAVDLTAVTATDERHARVTTADGRVFETADAGKTWQRQP